MHGQPKKGGALTLSHTTAVTVSVSHSVIACGSCVLESTKASKTKEATGSVAGAVTSTTGRKATAYCQ